MTEAIFSRIRRLFDLPEMQNNLRGLWVEAMICELLRDDWHHTGRDWAPWDLERTDGLRIEVKQSALRQSWGTSNRRPRFNIASGKGHYLEDGRFQPNLGAGRLADLYIFAWHEGQDQREVGEWRFHVVPAKSLPLGQKSLGLTQVRAIAEPVAAQDLKREVEKTADTLCTPSPTTPRKSPPAAGHS